MLMATQPCAAWGASQLDVVVVAAGAFVAVVPMLGFSAPKLAIACPSCCVFMSFPSTILNALL